MGEVVDPKLLGYNDQIGPDFLFKIDILIPIEGESCFDAAHIKLVAEVEELGESCRLLADKVRFREKAKKQSTEHY